MSNDILCASTLLITVGNLFASECTKKSVLIKCKVKDADTKKRGRTGFIPRK